MHPVLSRTALAPDVVELLLGAPRIAEIRRPGQFVIVRLGEGSERIPLTIADADPATGTITLIVQAVGRSTHELVALCPGEQVRDVAGPLGRPTELLVAGRAVCVGGGVGTAVINPIAQALSASGVTVVSVVGGRSADRVILTDRLGRYGQVLECTDDGSRGRHGTVADVLADLLAAGGVDHVYAVGPVPMMRACTELTRRHAVPTTVSLNSIMVDGTGMCGGCRVSVHGENRYVCVDGPEFDAHGVDFGLLADRLTTYRDFERRSMADWEVERTGPASTGPASTGPASTGPASTGPASTGTASTGTAATGTATAGAGERR